MNMDPMFSLFITIKFWSWAIYFNECSSQILSAYILICHFCINAPGHKNIDTRFLYLTYWGRVMHICVSKLTIIGSDNGLSPGRRQAIIWTNAGIVNWTLGNKFQWNLNRIQYIFIQENAFEDVVCEMASMSSRPQCVKFLNWAIYIMKINPKFFVSVTPASSNWAIYFNKCASPIFSI